MPEAALAPGARLWQQQRDSWELRCLQGVRPPRLQADGEQNGICEQLALHLCSVSSSSPFGGEE